MTLLFSQHFVFKILLSQMTFRLNRIKGKKPQKTTGGCGSFSVHIELLRQRHEKYDHCFLKRKWSKTNYDMLAKATAWRNKFALRRRDGNRQDSKLMKRSQNFGFGAEKEKRKKKKKRTFRPQLVSADGSLLWRAITQMLSIIDTGKSFGLTLFFGYGFNCPEYEVWGPLTYHINGSE